MPGRVFKRGDIYWIAFYARGKEYRTSAKTGKKREAEKLLSHYLGQVARGEFKGFGTESGLSLFEMLEDFLADCQQRSLRDVEITRYRTGHLRGFFKDTPVDNITERRIDLYVKSRLKAGRSRTTINRELQLLGQAMRLAKRRKLLADIPHIEKFSEQGNARQGFFEREAVERLLAHLPHYLQDFTGFAYHTGWRKGEIISLQWEDIRGDIIRLRPELAKNKTGRIIVMVGEVKEIIDRRRQERVESCPYVFHRDGRQVRYFYRAWRTASKKAGLPHLLFHDMRRTAVRNMDRAGVPRQTAKQITGHKTDVVYARYRIVNEQDIREGMERVQNFLKHGQYTDNSKSSEDDLPISD